MSIRIAGLGIGVILLSTIWAICLLLCLLLSRRRGIESGIKYILLAAIPTIILVFWPKNPCTQPTAPTDTHLPIDHIAIPRIILAAFLMLLCVTFGTYFFQQVLFFESNTRTKQQM
ncbi:hypothetical protein M3Y97_00892900 [Aphelenchoides bicaudatus]|nr:hypothetical protein M3Y97_00892900 [Aphelenchoides bicaudatus]